MSDSQVWEELYEYVSFSAVETEPIDSTVSGYTRYVAQVDIESIPEHLATLVPRHGVLAIAYGHVMGTYGVPMSPLLDNAPRRVQLAASILDRHNRSYQMDNIFVITNYAVDVDESLRMDVFDAMAFAMTYSLYLTDIVSISRYASSNAEPFLWMNRNNAEEMGFEIVSDSVYHTPTALSRRYN